MVRLAHAIVKNFLVAFKVLCCGGKGRVLCACWHMGGPRLWVGSPLLAVPPPPSSPPSSSLHRALQEVGPEVLAPVEERFRAWYATMSRQGLDMSICVDARAALEGGQCLVRLSGVAEEGAALRETAPLVLINDLDLVPLGRAMRGDPPASQQQQQQQQQQELPRAHSSGVGTAPRR